MVKIVREAQADGSVKWGTGIQPLADIANVEHFIPRDWISEDGFLPNEKFIEYARPLIEGEVRFPFEAGLPKYGVLEKARWRRNWRPGLTPPNPPNPTHPPDFNSTRLSLCGLLFPVLNAELLTKAKSSASPTVRLPI